ncbi:MAG TPA: YoaK family protein [Glaciihabitans sp.]|nr:YoaK family protein [Glaciihabitans sp.]
MARSAEASARPKVTHHWFTAGLLLLTASTGAIDAVSYLALDRVFTGNMTGNVLFIGFALVGVAGIPLLNNVTALVGFVLGSILGGRIVGRGHSDKLPRSSAWVLLSGGALALAIGIAWTILGELPHGVLLAVTFVLAVVMGAQVSAVKPVGNSDITTIVVTNTLANLARDSRLGGGKGQPWAHRLLAVIAMGAGAAIGAGAINLWGGASAMFAAVIIYVAGTTTLIFANRHHRSVA